MHEQEIIKPHAIKIMLVDGATQAILKPGNGKWVISDHYGTSLETKQPISGVTLRQTASEVFLEAPLIDGPQPVEVTVCFERESHTEDLLQAELRRAKDQVQGRVAVHSVSGQETEYLLDGDHFRFVTLPLSPPPPGGCHSDG